MISKTVNNRMMVVTVELAECPWLKGSCVQLPGYVHKDYVATLGDIRSLKLHQGVMLRCYESTSGKYVVNLHYGNRASDEDKRKAMNALNKWIANLSLASSCVIDPTTGMPPRHDNHYGW